jgi:uncharacterized protein
MATHQTNRNPIVFFLLTFAYSWILWLPSILSGLGIVSVDTEAYTAVVVPIGAFAPMLAAITLIARQHGAKESWRFIRQAFDFHAKPIYFGVALFLPILIHAITHYLAPAMGLTVADSLIPADLPVPSILLAILYFLAMAFIGGGQEEFGWRGYAQRPLQERIGVIPASLLIGVMWGLWHLPLWIMPGEPHATYPFLAFLTMTTGISVVYAWLFNGSGQKISIVIIFHAMNNTAAPFLPYLRWEDGQPETAYWLYAAVNVVFALVFAFLIRQEDKQKQRTDR